MEFEFLGIDHIQIAAPQGSEEIACNFFGEILKLKQIPKPKNLAKRGGVWFELGNKQLHIGIQQDFIPAKKAHPAFEIKELEALRDRLISKGIDVVEDEPLEGAKRFYASDPFGNRLEFIEWL